jgi:hypothetical protein
VRGEGGLAGGWGKDERGMAILYGIHYHERTVVEKRDVNARGRPLHFWFVG